MSRTLKVTGNHVMYDRGAWFLRVIMSSSRALCCLPSVKKQKHDFQVCFVDRAGHPKNSWRQGHTKHKKVDEMAKELFADYVKEKNWANLRKRKSWHKLWKHTFYVEARKKLFVECIIKQLPDSVFVISRMIKVSVRVINRSRRLRLIILDITKTSSNNCLKSLLFSLRLRVCVCLFIHSRKRKLAGPGGVFPAFCHATFHHAWITCCNVARSGYIWF